MRMLIYAHQVLPGMWIDGKQVMKVHKHRKYEEAYSFTYDSGYDRYRYNRFHPIFAEWRD